MEFFIGVIVLAILIAAFFLRHKIIELTTLEEDKVVEKQEEKGMTVEEFLESFNHEPEPVMPIIADNNQSWEDLLKEPTVEDKKDVGFITEQFKKDPKPVVKKKVTKKAEPKKVINKKVEDKKVVLTEKKKTTTTKKKVSPVVEVKKTNTIKKKK